MVRSRLTISFWILAGFLSQSGVLAQGLAQCPALLGDPCTASDINPSVISATTNDYCLRTTDTFDLEVTFSVQANGGNTRFDPVFWIPIEAEANPIDSSNQCWANTLNPDGSNHETPADGCNDLNGTIDGLLNPTRTFTISCDWNQKTLKFLLTWSQQEDALDCPTMLAGTGSKCFLDTSATVYVPRCGDGILDEKFGETCDDNNVLPGDGCDAACQLEILVFSDGFESLN